MLLLTTYWDEGGAQFAQVHLPCLEELLLMELWVDVLVNDYHQQVPLTANELEHWHILSYRSAADNCIKCESYQHSVKWHNGCFINENESVYDTV